MQSVEIFSCDRVLTQINAFQIVCWIKLFVAFILEDKGFVHFLERKGLAIGIISHKIEEGNLIGNGIAKIELENVFSLSIDNLEILRVMLFGKRVFQSLIPTVFTLYRAEYPSSLFKDCSIN